MKLVASYFYKLQTNVSQFKHFFYTSYFYELGRNIVKIQKRNQKWKENVIRYFPYSSLYHQTLSCHDILQCKSHFVIHFVAFCNPIPIALCNLLLSHFLIQQPLAPCNCSMTAQNIKMGEFGTHLIVIYVTNSGNL